jgi:hypothetical protein
LIWRELGKTEVSSGAINSYDGKNHVTFGRGFLATTGKNGGLMGEVLTKLFATDPAAQNMLLDAGFTIQNGTWLAVNITTGSALLEGSAALGMVQFDTSVLSLLTQLAEGPDHGQNVANAEWDVASKNAAAVPADCLSWPDSSILFGFHTITWHGAINWSMVKGTGGDIARMIRLTTSQNFGDVGSTDKDSGAYMVNGQSTQTFLGFANGAARAVLQSAGPLPDDIASTPNAYAGHIFFAAGGDQYYHLAP